ncbi:hypothetical protein IAQ61_007546 [Plenodomus lingam]|nr:hypothetical protein IAQ61_007546 [Plenodomus lingam]
MSTGSEAAVKGGSAGAAIRRSGIYVGAACTGVEREGGGTPADEEVRRSGVDEADDDNGRAVDDGSFGVTVEARSQARQKTS